LTPNPPLEPIARSKMNKIFLITAQRHNVTVMRSNVRRLRTSGG
jgi:hypothetical protein